MQTCEIFWCRYRASSRFAEINVKRAQLPPGIARRVAAQIRREHVRWLRSIDASRFNDLIELMTVRSTMLRGRPGQTKTWDVLRKLIHVRAAARWSAGGYRRLISLTRFIGTHKSFSWTPFHLTSIIICLISHDGLDASAHSRRCDLCTGCFEIDTLSFLKIWHQLFLNTHKIILLLFSYWNILAN